MKSTLRTLLVTILGFFLACGAALAQVQPSPGGPVHSRFGSLTLTMKAQPTTPGKSIIPKVKLMSGEPGDCA